MSAARRLFNSSRVRWRWARGGTRVQKPERDGHVFCFSFPAGRIFVSKVVGVGARGSNYRGSWSLKDYKVLASITVDDLVRLGMAVRTLLYHDVPLLYLMHVSIADVLPSQLMIPVPPRRWERIALMVCKAVLGVLRVSRCIKGPSSQPLRNQLHDAMVCFWHDVSSARVHV